MNAPLDHDEQLRQLVDRALRDQPLRRAPASLEANVMAAIAARAAAPWWRSSFAHWPVAARIVFLVASVGFIKLALQGMATLIDPLDATARGADLFAELSWIHALFATMFAVARSLPSLWVYGALAVLGAFYLMLFGISAAAYRTLYASR